MQFNDIELHAQGTSTFTDDIPLPQGTLHAFPVVSTIAHGKILTIDLDAALTVPGVVKILSAQDIPGFNNIGNIEAEEVLLADQTAMYQGQAIALVIAETETIARHAAGLVNIAYQELPAVFDARTAHAQGLHIAPSRIFSLGDVDTAWQKCDFVIEGSASTGAAEHVYLETQTSLAIPLENDGVKLFSATQSPGLVQKACAKVLGCPMHRIEVDVLRLGGGFGGKEEQATLWAALVALATFLLKKPVKIKLNRDEDMRLTGKRHPYDADFKIGLAHTGNILAYQVEFFQNAGAVADLSLAILERTLFHTGNTYFLPNVRATANSCRTHLPPNTAFRGFGGPQAMFVLESAIFKAAQSMNLDPAEIQQKNLLKDGDHFPYGMQAQQCQAQTCWQTMQTRYAIQDRQQTIDTYNSVHPLSKKALALMPICFGISFTATFLNQAGALVHIYTDGSVSVSSGAVEMGQGVKEKIRKIAAVAFAIDEARVKVESTNTSRIANMSPTAASVGSDLNGAATLLACNQILQNLKTVTAKLLGNDANAEQITFKQEKVYLNGEATAIDWRKLISQAYLSRTALSAHAHYATPGVYFDRSREKGIPFAYHVYGCAAVEVTVDCLHGIYSIDRVSLVHDMGKSLTTMVDRGQIEGGVVQGLGWMTIEEIIYDQQGRLKTDNLTNYKIPDLYFAPEIEIKLLSHEESPAVMHSKAIGEPPLMYGIGAYFALIKAIQAFNPNWQPNFNAPMTPEKVLLALYGKN
jgi:xanthine dehydrogenase large subunit